MTEHAKRWDELTKEDIGLRPLREVEKVVTVVTKQRDWRGVTTDIEGPPRPRRCSQSISSGRATYSCGDDAKWARDEGRYGRKEFFCANHAGGALRSAKVFARKAEEREDAETGESAARKRLAKVAKALGLTDTDLDYGWRDYSTTHAVVSIEELEFLAGRLS